MSILKYGMTPILIIIMHCCLGATCVAAMEQQPQPPSILPASTEPSPSLKQAVEAPYLTDRERLDLRIEHGLWKDYAELKSLPVALRAKAMMILGRYDDPVWSDPTVPKGLLAQVEVIRGNMDKARELIGPAPEDDQDACTLAKSHEWQGQWDKADACLDDMLTRYGQGQVTSAGGLLAVAQAMGLRGHYRNESSRMYNAIMQLTSQVHEKIDRLDWRSRLFEAVILHEKYNPEQAVAALHEVLALNPRCARAWYLLGQIALDMYDFDTTDKVITRLTELQGEHGVDTLTLGIKFFLVQNMPEEADRLDQTLLREFPKNRDGLALKAAVNAVYYDEDGMYVAATAFDRLSPGNPYALIVAGRYLSRNRQYDLAKEVLEKAIAMRPDWPEAHVELGLMGLQAGDDALSAVELRKAAELDPFNQEVVFSLKLLDDLSHYETIRSEHFIIRFDPKTTDRVLAGEMLEPLEGIYRDITTVFQYEPDRPTLIELMPDHSKFAVRITGEPELYTIAASTGPVIAMESPREGPDHFGPYDWQRVIRHEFVHTITLGETQNRITHWFTEAEAVWQELAPRDYQTCVSLADAYQNHHLFNLDEINWAFVRPRRPGDRSLAYAQGEWMVQYMVEKYGRESLIRLMKEFKEGFREPVAFPDALHISRDQFYVDFLAWAGVQVKRWGFMYEPSLDDIVQEYRRHDPAYREQVAQALRPLAQALKDRMTLMGDASAPFVWQQLRHIGADLPEVKLPTFRLTPAAVDQLLNQYSAQPDLLRLKIAQMQHDGQVGPALIPVLERYTMARPVDPLPSRLLAAIYLEQDQSAKAIPYLEDLDQRQQYDPVFAVELARQYRALGQYDRALEKIRRALSIKPFDPALREEAAAIAIQAGHLEEAKHQIEALTILEPDRPQHQKRLEAINRLIGEQVNQKKEK